MDTELIEQNVHRLLGRRPVRAPESRMVVLRDGSAVQIRPVRSADAPLLADGFARLSAASRRMRVPGREERTVHGGSALLHRRRPPQP